MPIGFPPDGLAGCVQAGTEKASAATTATPVTRCFMGVDPPLQLRGLSAPRPGRRWGGMISDPTGPRHRGSSTRLALHRPTRLSASMPFATEPLTVMDFGPNRHH